MISNKIEKLNLKEVVFKHDKLQNVITEIVGTEYRTSAYASTQPSFQRNKSSGLSTPKNIINYTYLNSRPLSIILHSTVDSEQTAMSYINKKHPKPHPKSTKNRISPPKSPNHKQVQNHHTITGRVPDKADLLSMDLSNLKDKLTTFRKFRRENIGNKKSKNNQHHQDTKYSSQHMFLKNDMFDIKDIKKTYDVFKRNIEKNRVKEHLKQVVLKYRDPKSKLNDELSYDEEVLKEYVQLESNKLVSSLYSGKDSVNGLEKLETKETENFYTQPTILHTQTVTQNYNQALINVNANERTFDHGEGTLTKFKTSPNYSPKISHTIAPMKKISNIIQDDISPTTRLPRMSLFQEKSTINSNFMNEMRGQYQFNTNNTRYEEDNSEESIIHMQNTRSKKVTIRAGQNNTAGFSNRKSSNKHDSPSSLKHLVLSPKSPHKAPIFSFEKNNYNYKMTQEDKRSCIKRSFKKIPLKKKQEIGGIVTKSEFDFNKAYSVEYKKIIEKLSKEHNSKIIYFLLFIYCLEYVKNSIFKQHEIAEIMQVKKDFAIEKLKKKYLLKKPIHVGQLVNIKDEDALGTRKIKIKISTAFEDYEKNNDMFK